MSTDPALLVSHGADGVVTLTMTAPKKVSVISPALARALQDALRSVAASADARVLVLTSSAASFCGGGDIVAIRDTFSDSDRLLGAFIDEFHAAILALRRLPIPVIASVRGSAAGGGFSLAMACDLVIAAKSARFVAGYPALGTSSDGGLSHFLTKRLGAMKALEALLVTSVLSADEACRLGLVARVVDDEQLGGETAALAAKLAQTAPQAVREFKQLIGGAEDGELPAQLAREREAFLRCARTDDFRRRVMAFLEPRRS